MIRNLAKKIADKCGYEVRRKDAMLRELMPTEFDKTERDIVHYIVDNDLSMTPPERICATIFACKHVVLNDIAGDFIECGVWRGGQSLAAKMALEHLGSNKQVYMFDTFAGMTEPTDADTSNYTDEGTIEKFQREQQSDHNEWAYASLGDVQNSCKKAGVNMDGIHLIEGDVLKTLEVTDNIPQSVSILRLDTDWYESTLKELDILYPKLTIGGAILVDDYGHWDGSRKAVDEYFARDDTADRPLVHYTDYSARAGVKVG